jgi:hypothetical protein
MVKALVRITVPIHEELEGKTTLPPGEYEANVGKDGMIAVYKDGGSYLPSPGTFEFIKVDKDLLNYWRASVAVIKAQQDYKNARSEFVRYFLENLKP